MGLDNTTTTTPDKEIGLVKKIGQEIQPPEKQTKPQPHKKPPKRTKQGEEPSKLVRAVQETPQEFSSKLKGLECVAVYIFPTNDKINTYLSDYDEEDVEVYPETVLNLTGRFLDASQRAGLNCLVKDSPRHNLFRFFYNMREKYQVFSLKLGH